VVVWWLLLRFAVAIVVFVATDDSRICSRVMKKVEIGKTGVQVSALGLGCMAMTGDYGDANEEECLKAINTALDKVEDPPIMISAFLFCCILQK